MQQFALWRSFLLDGARVCDPQRVRSGVAPENRLGPNGTPLLLRVIEQQVRKVPALGDPANRDGCLGAQFGSQPDLKRRALAPLGNWSPVSPSDWSAAWMSRSALACAD
jgi:hypothetical protein